MRVREDMADMQRSADGGWRRINGVHVTARTAAIKLVGLLRLPALLPFGLESFQRRFSGT